MTERLAVVDLGSNAVRLVLARIRPGVDFEILREERVRTRLGGGPPGTLPSAAVRETIDAVCQFLDAVRGRRPPRVVAVGTAALRDARNAERLMDALRREAGVALQILTGDEEARLGAMAALSSIPLDQGVVFDLGGGSLQLSRVASGAATPLGSVPIGSLRATREFLRHDPPTRSELEALRAAARDALRGPVSRAGDGTLVGLGGSLRALARIVSERRGRRAAAARRVRITRHDVSTLVQRLAQRPLSQRRKVRGLKADRADTIVAGAVVVEELMALGGWDAVVVSPRGVRHGLLVRETYAGAAPR